jgi:hypothetical protein
MEKKLNGVKFFKEVEFYAKPSAFTAKRIILSWMLPFLKKELLKNSSKLDQDFFKSC